jgi:hypothetical protein
MTRYHVSRSGKAALCRATEGNCPLSSRHFPRREDATFWAELQVDLPQEMLLHGTNVPLAPGTLIRSAKRRKAKPVYSQSSLSSVYATATDWVQRDGDDSDETPYNPMWEGEEGAPEDQLDPRTYALASAMRYGVNSVAFAGLHVASRSRLADASNVLSLLDGVDHVDGEYASDEEIKRYNAMLTPAEPKLLLDTEWRQMTREEQDAYNTAWEDAEPEPAPTLRGYWVYRVEAVKGEVEKDHRGQSAADRELRNGELRVVAPVVWDGVLVDDSFSYPPMLAKAPELEDEDLTALRAWRTMPVTR